MSTTETAAIAERVAAGAAFLDEHDPPWWREDTERAIDLGALNLAEPDVCVLGQRCPVETLREYWDGDARPDDRYWAYAEKLKPGDTTVFEWALGLGFTEAMTGDFRALTAEWKRLIGERRAAA